MAIWHREVSNIELLIPKLYFEAKTTVFTAFLYRSTDQPIFLREIMDKVGISTPFSDKVGGGKIQTSSPPVITPNRSQSNPDDMITLPRPIQSVGMDLHDVSGTSTGQTLPRERRAPPGTHFCPTIWWVYPHSATIFILHPLLLSTFSSTFVRNIKQQLQGSCARVRRI